MRLPIILSTYFGRQFFFWFLGVIGGLLTIVYVGEALELLRRATARPEVSFGLVAQMAAFKLPGTAQVLFPSAVLFTALYTFWRLTRGHELEVTRAAGVSAWGFILPITLAAVLLGIIQVTLINPLGAAMVSRFERMEEKHFRGSISSLEISGSGIWISQSNGQQQAFIHAESLKPGTFELKNVMIYENPHDIQSAKRVDAAAADLKGGAWILTDAHISISGQPPVAMPEYRLPTDLTRQRIEESFASPDTLSFWQLPAFIQTLQVAGLSSLRHELYFQSLLAKPLLLAAMVLIAAAFGLRQSRRGGVVSMIVGGLVIGLLLFVTSDIVQTFAQSGAIPVILAAWGPAIVGVVGGAAALFHLEDG